MFCWGTFYLSRASTTCLIVEFLMTFWILSTSSTNISDFDIHQGTIKEEWLWLFGIFFSSMWLNSKAKSHLLIGSFFRCSSELCPNLQQMEASKATCGFADEMQWLRHDVRHFIKPVCTSSDYNSLWPVCSKEKRLSGLLWLRGQHDYEECSKAVSILFKDKF